MFRGFLKASTAATRQLGPFVDATDGHTLENSLTLTKDTNVVIVKNGTAGTWSATGVSLVSAGSGLYTLPIAADDVDTVGTLEIVAYSASNARPLLHAWTVLPANTYDSLIAGSDALQVDTIQVSGTVQTAGDIPALVTTVDTAVDAILVDTGTTLPSSLSYAKDDVIDKRTWKFTKNTSSTRSPNIVTVNPNFDGTLKFDLANVLNKGAGINAITSVTVSPSGPTITGPNGAANPAKTSDNQAVLFDVSGGQVDGVDHVFTCTVTTTDSDDALVVSGLLKYRST